MRSEWKKIKWGNVSELKYGKSLRNYNSFKNSVPVYGTNGLIGSTEKALCQHPSVIIGRKGAYRGIHYSPVPFYVIDTAFYLEIKNSCEIDYKWAYYALKTKDINSMDSGSAIPSTSREDFYSLSLVLPSLPEQKAIAATLSCLDDKIELNNRINANLEAQAQAIFKSWFVDFEPFRDGEFEDSELGPIPKGWRVGRADSFFDIAIGKTPPRKEPQWFTLDGSDVKWASISDMGDCGTYIFNTSEYLTPEAVHRFKIKLVPANTVLLSFKLTIGRVAITAYDLTTNEAIAHFKTDKSYFVEYLYLYLKNMNYNSLGSTSSIATAINSKIVKSMLLMMPSDYILKVFYDTIIGLFSHIKCNIAQNQTLAAMRDALLPRLMSGEIEVPVQEI